MRSSPAHGRPQTSTWTDADEQRLHLGVQALGLRLDDACLTQVSRWAALLLQWNRTYNLLGAQDGGTLVGDHLLDSLAILPVIEQRLPAREQVLTDVGTGAGFPGILLAIAQPDRPIHLLEPIGKKVAFLRQSVLTLGLKNARVLAGRIEDLDALLSRERIILPTGQPRHFICRAFTALGRFASLCQPYMSEDSLAFAMKAARLAEEQQQMPASMHVAAIETLPTPNPDIQRYLAILKRGTALSADAASLADQTAQFPSARRPA